ncbi:MAG: hypothetical protein ACI3Z0_00700 [Candidatus Cryptobacteroides sp.]
MKKTIIIVLLLAFAWLKAGAQEIGANYNELLGGPLGDVRMLRESGVTWVRGFIDIPLKFLTKENGVIAGVDEDKIRNSQLLRQYSQAQGLLGDQVKFMLSFKIPFLNDTGLVPAGETGIWEHIFRAAELILESYGLGDCISLLVMGNEPMWENNDNANTPQAEKEVAAANYKAFLNEFASRIAGWKAKHGWTFEVFAGALNRISEVDSPVIQAVMDVVNGNPDVDGLDLHIHAARIAQCGDDLNLARTKYGVTKKLICTEFSMVRAIDSHNQDALGTWGSQHGYSSTMKIYEYLNAVIGKANAGTPVTTDEFGSLFNGLAWYPKNWYSQFYEAFKTYGTYAITGRFSVVPNKVVYTTSTQMWELGGIYSPKFFGYTADGAYSPNPLVYPDFIAARDGIAVRRFIEGQRDMLLVLNGAAAEGSVLKIGDSRTVNLEAGQDWVKVDGLEPGTKYHLTYLSGGGDILWERDIVTRALKSGLPLLNVEEAADYRWIQVRNLPDDAVSVKIFIDGRETGAVVSDIKGKVLSAEITYDDSSVETVRMEL